MDQPYLLLSLRYAWDGMEQCVHPVLLFGEGDTVLVDCGYPGSLEQLEAELRSHSIPPERLTKLVLTHQDDDHAGAAAEIKARYPAIQILASEAEAPYIAGERKNLRLCQAENLQTSLPEDQQEFGRQFCDRLRRVKPVPVDRALRPGETFDWGGGCAILATPGHTPGHISIRALDGGFLVAGDAAVVEEGALAVANPEYCMDIEAASKSLERLKRLGSRRWLCYHGGCLEV